MTRRCWVLAVPLLRRGCAAMPGLSRAVSSSASTWSSSDGGGGGSRMKKLINDPQKAVTDALAGFLSCQPQLRRLDGFPDIKVVFDPHHDKSKVAIISGGGSGHEPAHVGYVGSGMLAAAVAGEVFASPPAAAVLAAIRAVTGPGGCLLVVKNYTGDRLNFGLAAEQAKAEGLAVDVVVVGEDAAIATPGLAGRRGLAGTVLVHKIAGAAAAAGIRLSEVAYLARQVAARCVTLGVALHNATLPGQQQSLRLGPTEVELGLGIHNEPGAQVTRLTGAAQLVDTMMSRLINYKATSPRFVPGSRVALLINNLGSTPPLELAIVAGEALRAATDTHQLDVSAVLTGHFMTSLDMQGASITLLATTPDMETLLAETTAAPCWPNCHALAEAVRASSSSRGGGRRSSKAGSGYGIRAAEPVPLPPGPADNLAAAEAAAGVVTAADASDAAAVAFAEAVRAAARAVLGARNRLNQLDARTGDGDCGDTIGSGAAALLAALDDGRLVVAPAAAAVRGLAGRLRQAMGGTSGGLYDVALTAAAAALLARAQQGQQQVAAEVGVEAWAAAFAAGAAAVERYGGAAAGCRTMLDALLPAAQALAAAAEDGKSGAEALAAAAAAAEVGAAATQAMPALAGRSSYVPKSILAKTPDPGAVAVSIWLKALAAAH